MSTSRSDIKKRVEELLQLGRDMYMAEYVDKCPDEAQEAGVIKEEFKGISVHSKYQTWYSQCLPLIRQVAPERYNEFIDLYRLEKRKDVDYYTYTINDYLSGTRVSDRITGEEIIDRFGIFITKMDIQNQIIESCLDRLDSTLSNIQGTLQADLFDNELSAAGELLKKGHARAAGALTGVTLERHLSTVCDNHNIKFLKKGPTISDFNEELKKASIYDVPQWRFISRLADFRNMSVHPKEREPTKEEIQEMIEGVQKVIKTVF